MIVLQTATQDRWNDEKRHNDGLKCDSDEENHKYNSKIPKAAWSPLQYAKRPLWNSDLGTYPLSTPPPPLSVRWDPTYQYTRRCKVWRPEKAKICAEMKLPSRTHWPKNRRWPAQACGQFCRITAHQQLHQQAIHQRQGKWRESWELPCHKPGRTRMEVIEKQILKTFILAKNSRISFRNKLKNGTGTVSFPVLSIWIARGEAWPKEARGVMGEGKRNYILIRYPAQTNVKHLSCNKQPQLGCVNTSSVRLSYAFINKMDGNDTTNGMKTMKCKKYSKKNHPHKTI